MPEEVDQLSSDNSLKDILKSSIAGKIAVIDQANPLSEQVQPSSESDKSEKKDHIEHYANAFYDTVSLSQRFGRAKTNPRR